MRCSACRAENPAGKKSCGECGAALENRCPQCGADNPANKKFCGECGDLLAPLYEWFTEGFDTCDLKDAKALPEELGT